MITTILFDLGQVLIRLGDEGPINPEWLTSSTPFTLTKWFHSPTGLAFERGELPPQRFAETLITDLGLTISPEQLLEHFTAWPQGWFDGATGILTHLASRYELAVLSNTNELHYPRLIDEFGLDRYFTEKNIFASHQIGRAKPDPDCFNYVLSQLNRPAAEVLFLDDSSANIASARAIGMHAEQVTGCELKQLLERKDIL